MLWVNHIRNRNRIMEELNKLRNIQINLRKLIDLRDINTSRIKTIAGVDTSYVSVNDKEFGICCIEVFNYNNMEHIEHVSGSMEVTQPYISGFFSFRELPIIIDTLRKLSIVPDVFMIDGNGYLHEYNMGIATMFSIYTEYPSIGVAKNYYHIDGAKYIQPENIEGSSSEILVDDKCYGYAIRTKENCKPIFASPGSLVTFENTLEIVRNCVDNDSRVPTPTRIADIETHKEKKKFLRK